MIVTDSASLPESVNSIPSSIVTINASNITTTTTSTTTIPPSGGTSGGSTGGLVPQPSIKVENSCVVAAGISEFTKFNFKVNNQTFTFNERSIGSSNVTVLINGNLYTLYMNNPLYIQNGSIYLNLQGISQGNPSTATINTCATGLSSVVQLFGTSYLPIYTSAHSGESVNSQFSIQNTGINPEYLTIQIPKNLQPTASLSANTAYLLPGQSASIGLSISSPQNTTPGLYFIPVNITATTSTGLVGSETEYLGLDIYGSTLANPYTSTQLQLLNNSQVLSATIQIHSPMKSPLNNVTLSTILPPGITNNISNVKAYGLPNNITSSNGSYVINWFIDALPANQLAYAYYLINNYHSSPNVQYIQQKFSGGTQPPVQGSLTIVRVSVPTFYSNSTNKLSVYSQYSGTSSQPIRFVLNSSKDAHILNPVQEAAASPGEIINTTFDVVTSNFTGTLQLDLEIGMNGTNQSYPMPVFVLKKPEFSMSVSANQANKLWYIAGALISAIIIYLIITHLRDLRREGKNKKSIENIKNQIQQRSGKSENSM